LAKELILAKVLQEGQAVAKGLARACQISSHNVLPKVDRVEAVLLDGKQIDDPSSLKLLDSLQCDLWIAAKFAVLQLVRSRIVRTVSLSQPRQAGLFDLLYLLRRRNVRNLSLIEALSPTRMSPIDSSSVSSSLG